eukprot:3252567-Amphidinium_carterae.1
MTSLAEPRSPKLHCGPHHKAWSSHQLCSAAGAEPGQPILRLYKSRHSTKKYTINNMPRSCGFDGAGLL